MVLGCHFVNLFIFASSSFFLSLRKITWLNSQQPKTRGHEEHHGEAFVSLFRMHIQVSCVLFLDFLGKTCKEVHLENQYKSSNDMTTVSLVQCSWPDVFHNISKNSLLSINNNLIILSLKNWNAYLSLKLVKWINLKNLTVAIKRLKHLRLFPCTIVHVHRCNFVKNLGHHMCNQTYNPAMEIPTLC